MACTAPLLRPGAAEDLRQAFDRYPDHYDDVLNDVHDKLVRRGAATKLELAALIAWKHVRNARWMKALLSLPIDTIHASTAAAFAPGISDHERVDALAPLPGFGSGGAFTSVLLTAWDPTRFGVYDRLVNTKRSVIVVETCACTWSDLPTYWDHLRALAVEMRATNEAHNREWTPRDVEMAILNV